MDGIARLLDQQSGLIARRQVLACGGTPATIERALRRRDWVRLLPGVFLDHTGVPTWQQRAWAGVLFYWPAALSGSAALRSTVGAGWRRHDESAPIDIAVAVCRTLRDVPGYRVRRCTHLDDRVQWNSGPPRLHVEHAALDVASVAHSRFETIALLADVCQSRRTTATRLLAQLDDRARVPERAWVAAVLRDVAAGTCSVLEHGYLTQVELAHGLPHGQRQEAAVSDRGPIFRDIHYLGFFVIVELDGRLFHDTAGQRDRDLDRDLDAAVDGMESVRLGWGQVFDRPCGTAERIGRLLRARGWSGSPHPCGPQCPVS